MEQLAQKGEIRGSDLGRDGLNHTEKWKSCFPPVGEEKEIQKKRGAEIGPKQ